MKTPFEDTREELQLKVLGLGGASLHRSHHPGVRQRLSELERIHALTDLAGDLLLAVDLPSGGMIEFNETVCREVGKRRDELLCATFQDIFGSAPWELLLTQRVPGHTGRSVISTELLLGQARITAEIVARFVTSRNRAYAILAIRDITGRLRADAELRESTANLAQASRLAHLGTWTWDWRRGRMRWSPELCLILGVPAAEERSVEDFNW